jgi:catechol 2,3-dioxygenase-like lactoylglutathione lyase family enzyme
VDEEAVRPAVVATASAVHHVGMSVANLDQALAFWENFLGVKARWRTVLNRPYLGEIVGIPGVSIQAAFVDLPGGVVLELLDYETPGREANPETTSNPGNVHLCLAVDDIDLAWKRAVGCGARPVRREGAVVIDGGPNVGARGAYLRVHDAITLELFQRPPDAERLPP